MHLILRIHIITEQVGSGGYTSDFNVNIGLNVFQDTDLRVSGSFLTPACKMLGETLN
jgi:hypothetical protein